ncbi:GIY-YIG nuclease family protein [Lachnospiraceae bacterium C1.1]|nr:GIY-YIG nuclease family protein [Lachnospiraceae bacterium C1.1]
MGAKAINIVLLDGTLEGVVSVEDPNGNELILSAPRKAALELMSQKESQYFGVYLLLSDNCVYIGKTTDYSQRIRSHLKVKKFWNKVVFLTTTDNKLNESHIKHIERVLIEKAEKNNKLDMDNCQSGNRTNSNRTDKVMLENYLNNILFLLEFINIDVFSNRKNSNIRYYKFENKNVALIDKTTVRDFLLNKGIDIGFFGKDYSYTGPKSDSSYYTIDSDRRMLEKGWRIVINDTKNYKIIIINVPEKAIIDYGIDRFNMKAGKPNKISVRIKKDNFCDTSGFDFSKYITQEVSYAE